MNAASAQKSEDAKRRAANGLKVCADSEKQVLEDIVEAFGSGKVYAGEEGSLMRYLEIENPIQFFRCL